MTTLSLLDAAAEAPDTAALIADGVQLTYTELGERLSRTMAHLIDRGIALDEPRAVAVHARAEVATIELVLGLITAGVPVVPVHPRLPPRAVEQRLAELEVSLVAPPSREFDGRSPPPHRAIEPARPLALVETSGTSGAPKRVVLSRQAFVAAAEVSARNLGWTDGDSWLLAIPPAHIGGLSIVTRCLLARRTIVLAEGNSAESLIASIVRHRVTLLSLVPTQLRRLVAARQICPSHVRAVLVGGAGAPRDLLRAAVELKWPVLTTYGLTETCSQVATASPGVPNPDGVGVGHPLVDVRISDGRIEVWGPTLLSGYWSDEVPPDRFGLRVAPPPAQGGWFRTGDRGRIDERGVLAVLGRADDVIVTGGENVAPEVVEAALEASPEVVEACVFGEPDTVWGERVVAVVVPARSFDEDKLLERLKAVLAPHEMPRVLRHATRLARTESGKLDRAGVRRAHQK